MMCLTGKNLFGSILLLLLLNGCTSAELAIDLLKQHQRKEAASKAIKSFVAKPHYKIGNPYQEFGIWYYPKRDLTYDETGLASWYGEETAILGRPTANGEAFDPKVVTAAHKTLPMPSVVRVTNLDNGKSLVVRVNDRGPFAPGRIVDLSHEGARLLGFVENGIAKVRVKVLAEQSLRLENLAKRGEFPTLTATDQGAMPKMVAAIKPKVNIIAKSNKIKSKVAAKKQQSAIELLAQSRVGEVILVAPVKTRIWIQVGAFHANASAMTVLSKIKGVGRGEVSTVNHRGKTLYRVRLGPLDDVAKADTVLEKVVNTGFTGARIIVD
ncbi:septal ring lytic transglycosylase RlpA family protein [Candidatus Puniceispirillum sp.]|nr:septal ring lytic transglycosylase RlpA family protein [Candidatus Puniceispirillum sp.]